MKAKRPKCHCSALSETNKNAIDKKKACSETMTKLSSQKKLRHGRNRFAPKRKKHSLNLKQFTHCNPTPHINKNKSNISPRLPPQYSRDITFFIQKKSVANIFYVFQHFRNTESKFTCEATASK